MNMAITNNRRRTCDIVMKGGITSGVVYPKAISRLSARFTFRNIGGTSAGAIAAAVAAAAEHRRVTTGSDDGFVEIDELGKKLAARPDEKSKSMLFSLFAPNAKTKRVFEVLTAPLGLESRGEQVMAVLWRAIAQYLLVGILGMLPGIAIALVSFYWSGNAVLTSLWVAVGILIGLAGTLIAVAAVFLYEFIAEVPNNGYGLCNGMADSEPSDEATEGPLTVWLSKYLNHVAGIPNATPLTFGDLWGLDGIQNAGARKINLEMMTTNLTHGRPYRLPFRNDEDLRENYLFYFCKKEFAKLFPTNVVEWMVNNPRPILPGTDTDGKRAEERAKRKEKGYFPLPNPENLPVIVATRMSLSFPVLLASSRFTQLITRKEKKTRSLSVVGSRTAEFAVTFLFTFSTLLFRDGRRLVSI